MSTTWRTTRLKFVVDVDPIERGHGLDDESPVSFLPMEAIGEDGSVDLSRIRPLSTVRDGYTGCRNGDVVVAKITPCFENGKGALLSALENGVGFGTTELFVLRPSPAVDARFLYYLTASDAFRKPAAAQMYGAGGQKRVPPEFVRDFTTALPLVPQQRAIADFLDRDTAKIEELIGKKKELLEKLESERVGIATLLTTKGLSGEQMQSTGFPWLPEIPDSWKLVRHKHCASHVVDCPHSTPSYDDTGGCLVVRTSDVTLGRLNLASMRRVSEEEYLSRIERLRPLKNDIVYTREGERYGLAALIPLEAPICLGQRMMQFRMSASMDPAFAMWALNSEAALRQAQVDVTGATSPHVNVDTIRNLRLPQPPITEQRLIAERIEAAISKIERTEEAVGNAIDRLKELRAALITAAVTGRIDVHERAGFDSQAPPET